MYNKKAGRVDLGKYKKPNPYKQDIIVDPMGQWKYPGQPTRIPGNEITMQGVSYPVLGIDNLGNQQMMYPDQNYTFPGQYVDEYPMAKKGGALPKLPNKKSSKRYSRNVLATNKLFAQNSLTKKAKSPKGKIFDPYAKYFQVGGVNSLEGNYISNIIMNRNRGTDFVDRAYALGANPGTPMFNLPDDEEFGSYMSHKMATGEDDSGQAWMFPTVLNPNNEAIKVPNQYADYISSEGYKYATGMKKEGGFHTDLNKHRKFLRDWTYSQSIGMLQEKDGGYIELELTPEEIEEYKKGGYIVEDISIPYLTQAQKGKEKTGNGFYTFQGKNYVKNDGKWLKQVNGQYVPLTKGDVAKRSAVLNAQAHKLSPYEIEQRGKTQSTTRYNNIEFPKALVSESTAVRNINSKPVDIKKQVSDSIKKSEAERQQDINLAVLSENEKVKNYYKEYEQSPRYREMLKQGDPEQYEDLWNARHFNLYGEPNSQFNFPNVYTSLPINTNVFSTNKGPLVKYQSEQPEDRPNTGGFSMSHTGDITVLPQGVGVKGLLPHEWSHSIDRPSPDYIEGYIDRIIPKRDENFINKSKPKSFYQSPYWKSLDPYDREWYLQNKNQTNINDWLQEKKDFLDYVAEPTETRARLNDIRYQSKQRGIYDPFNQKVTPEIFDKILKTKFESGDKEGFDALRQLKDVYTDEEILWMLNNVSKNTEQNSNLDDIDKIPQAQTGQSMNYPSWYKGQSLDSPIPDFTGGDPRMKQENKYSTIGQYFDALKTKADTIDQAPYKMLTYLGDPKAPKGHYDPEQGKYVYYNRQGGLIKAQDGHITVSPFSYHGDTPGLYRFDTQNPTFNVGYTQPFGSRAVNRLGVDAMSAGLTAKLPYMNNTGMGIQGDLHTDFDEWHNFPARMETDFSLGYDPKLGFHSGLIASPQFTFGNVQPTKSKVYGTGLKSGEFIANVGPFAGASAVPGRKTVEERFSIPAGVKGNIDFGIGRKGIKAGLSGYAGADLMGSGLESKSSESGLKPKFNYGIQANLKLPIKSTKEYLKDLLTQKESQDRDYTPKIQYGGLPRAQVGKQQKSKAPWEDYGVITYKDNADLINSTANFDMISKVPVSQQYNEQIKHRLYTGNYGYDPKTGQLVKLKSSQRGTVSKEDQKMLNLQEEKKIQEESKDIIEQQKLDYLNSIINAGYDPATFAGAYLPESKEYKDYFEAPDQRSFDELQKIPWEKWSENERNAWLEQGYYSTMFNPAFQAASLFTPAGAAIGTINALANIPLDLYNKDYSTAALNALELIPGVRPFTRTVGRGAKTLGTGMSRVAEKVLPKYKTNNVLGNQRAFTVQGDIGKGIGTNLTTSDVQRTIDDQLKWITSEEYYKRRSANTGETYDQIFTDVNKTIKNAQDAKINVNATLPENIGGRQTPRSLNTLWGPPTIEVSRTTANPPMVLKHEVGHLYSPAGFDVSTSKLHRGFDNPNVASLPANKRGVYANYPKIGGDDMDEYLQLGYEQQVRHLNARDQILSKYNLDKEAPLTEDQVYDFVTNWNKKILNRKAGFSDADSNFHFGKEEDYDDIWLDERNKIVQDQKDKYGLEDPVKKAQLSKEDIKRLTEEANRLLSKKITDVLNKAWATVPVGIGAGIMAGEENSSKSVNQAPGGQFQFGGESEYEDLELTPEEIDWYLTNGYDLEILPE